MAIDHNGKVVEAPAYKGISEGAARAILAKARCANVSSLTHDTSGTWHATCQMTPLPVEMMVSADGKADPENGYGGMSADRARSILSGAGCNTISNLDANATGEWTGTCWKGGAPVQASVSANGRSMFR
jgi:hypothetical protein